LNEGTAYSPAGTPYCTFLPASRCCIVQAGGFFHPLVEVIEEDIQLAGACFPDENVNTYEWQTSHRKSPETFQNE